MANKRIHTDTSHAAKKQRRLGAGDAQALCIKIQLMDEETHILVDLNRYRRRRKIAAYILPVVILLFVFTFIFENYNRFLTVTTGTFGAVAILIFTILVKVL